jgi:hypothetical protein
MDIMNNLFQYWVSYYKKDKWYLIVPFLIFLAGIIVLVSQVSIELSEAIVENIKIALFVLVLTVSLLSTFLIYKYTDSNKYTLSGFFLILFVTGWAYVKIVGFITERYEHESAIKGGFATVEEYKTAKFKGFDTKEMYVKHIQEQARIKAEQEERARAEQEARTRAEQEARARAEQERARAEQEERARAQQVRLKKEQERVAAEERCRQDLQCLAEKHFAYATVYCANQIKRLARFDFEWTDKWHERKFSHFRWKNRENGVITYMGDKARFQNAFGAMQPHI